jgi:hypothetical protein
MNRWEQFSAFLWLRWRLRRNRVKRAAGGSVIIEAIFAALAVLFGLSAFFIGLAAGFLVVPRTSTAVVMLIWDGAVAGFLMLWLVDLVAELQRSEVLSLDKFLHLPVSLSSVFLMNYISSLYSPYVTIFLPGMIGLALGMTLAKGPRILLLFPLVATFFLMVTALTYQFRGWLASLMQNKRRRRTIITVLTLVMVLLFQLPNLLTFGRFSGRASLSTQRAIAQERRTLERKLAAREIDPDEYRQRLDEILKKYHVPPQRPPDSLLNDAERVARTVNRVVPPGWLPYGVATLLEGRVAPSIYAALGLTLIGTASLMRSYKTAVRLYTGHFTGRRRRQPAVKVETIKAPQRAPIFMEKQIPWISEQASAITVACFRSLTRAPESKMMLLSPIIFTLIFGSTFLRVQSDPPQVLRPIMAAGLMGMILLGLAQLAGNQFGFDRNGFRVFVLAAASRRDILLGKNLALLPFALGLGVIGISALQIAYPMRIDHWLAAMVQMISMFLVFSILNNFLSILAPVAMSLGSLRPARPKGMAILLQFLFFFLVMPIAMGLTLIPLGIEYFLPSLPVYLVLTLVEFVVIVYFYRQILGQQGTILQKREQKILDIVAAKVD